MSGEILAPDLRIQFIIGDLDDFERILLPLGLAGGDIHQQGGDQAHDDQAADKGANKPPSTG